MDLRKISEVAPLRPTVGDQGKTGGGLPGRLLGGLISIAIQVVTNPKLSQNLADIGKARYNLSGTASKDTLSTAIGWATSTITRTGNNTGTFKAAELPEGSVSYPPTLSSSKNANTHGDDGPGHSGGLSPADVTLSLPTLAPGTEAKTAGSSSEPTTSVFLDISNPDTSKVDIVKDSKNGVEHTTYTPKSGSKMTSVVDGQTSIWTSSGNEKCTFAELSSKGDSSLLLISLENAYVYFEKNADGEWVSIEDGYDRKIEELQDIAKQKGSQVAARDNLEANAEPNDRPEETTAFKPTESKEEASPQANGATQKSQQMITTDPNTLDISNPDKSNVDEESGKDSKKYFPKDNKHFNEVKEGDTSIWRAGANEYCKFVRVSLKGNTATEVSLNVRNNAEDKNITVKNYKKEGGLWQLISGRSTDSDSSRTSDGTNPQGGDRSIMQ